MLEISFAPSPFLVCSTHSNLLHLNHILFTAIASTPLSTTKVRSVGRPLNSLTISNFIHNFGLLPPRSPFAQGMLWFVYAIWQCNWQNICKPGINIGLLVSRHNCIWSSPVLSISSFLFIAIFSASSILYSVGPPPGRGRPRNSHWNFRPEIIILGGFERTTLRSIRGCENWT